MNQPVSKSRLQLNETDIPFIVQNFISATVDPVTLVVKNPLRDSIVEVKRDDATIERMPIAVMISGIRDMG
jgi:hypothetical protein